MLVRPPGGAVEAVRQMRDEKEEIAPQNLKPYADVACLQESATGLPSWLSFRWSVVWHQWCQNGLEMRPLGICQGSLRMGRAYHYSPGDDEVEEFPSPASDLHMADSRMEIGKQ